MTDEVAVPVPVPAEPIPTAEEQALEVLTDLLEPCALQESADGFRTCVFEQIPKQQHQCKLEAVLVTQSGCPLCDTTKEKLAGTPFRELDIAEADKLEHVEYTPQLWLVDCTGRKVAELEL